VSITVLVWQVISWRRSGARLHVATKWGIAGVPPTARWFISIEARNTGRLATEINQVGFQMAQAEERRQIVDFEDVLGMPIQLPRTLAAGGTTSVMYAADRLLATLHNEGLTGKDARPYVDTGAGRTFGRRKQDLCEMARKLIDQGTG
jgi:hypothetical protein